MIFNLKFIEFFFIEKDKKENYDYNTTLAKSAIQFIMTLKGKDVKLSEEEFKKNCSETLALEKNNKITTPTPYL